MNKFFVIKGDAFFKSDRRNYEGDLRERRPKTASTSEIDPKILNMVFEVRRLTEGNLLEALSF